MLFCALRKRRLALSTALLVAPSSLSSRNASAFSSAGLLSLFSAWPSFLNRRTRLRNLRSFFKAVLVLQLVQRLAQLLEPPHSSPQPPELFQGRLGPAAAVKEPVHLVHDLAQGSQLRPPVHQLPQLLLLGGTEVMADKQIAVLKQFRHTPFPVSNQPGLALPLLAGAAARLLGDLRRHLLAEFRQRVHGCLDDLLEDVECAELVPDARPQPLERPGVKRRSVRGDAAHAQAALVQLPFEFTQESEDVVLGRVVVEGPESQALVPAVVHGREDAERAVVDFVDRQVAAEVSQGVVEVGTRQGGPEFCPPRPRPSSGWWHRGRRRGGRATGASWRLDEAGRPRRPGGRPAAGRGGCTGIWARPGRADRR